jgi:threonine dehydrogenase-like Zn-dependent dehydrogenase
MKAVVFHDIGDIRLDDVPDPRIQRPTDALVRLTASAICGTDLHIVRGTMGPMEPGTILGHEGVGIVEEVGQDIRNLKPGDRVVICSTIACGYCGYCRAGYFSQCDNANPNGKRAGTAFFGGPKLSGPFDGMQGEKVRVPFASCNCVKLPEDISDDQAILISDIFPTAYFGAMLAEIKKGDMVAVFGCGPVGLFAIKSCELLSAGRIFAIDHVESRLDMARQLGAEIINFETDDPVDVILKLTDGIGVDRIIDAVGVDAQAPKGGPAAAKLAKKMALYQQEMQVVAPKTNVQGENWRPGNAPSIVHDWAVECIAKAGTLAIIGVYPETVQFFPIGQAMLKNLTINMGNCNHRKYIPVIIEIVTCGMVHPEKILSKIQPIPSAIEAYKQFDLRASGWTKVELVPQKEYAWAK